MFLRKALIFLQLILNSLFNRFQLNFSIFFKFLFKLFYGYLQLICILLFSAFLLSI